MRAYPAVLTLLLCASVASAQTTDTLDSLIKQARGASTKQEQATVAEAFKQLPASAIVPIWDLLADRQTPDSLREVLLTALPEIYAQQREARIADEQKRKDADRTRWVKAYHEAGATDPKWDEEAVAGLKHTGTAADEFAHFKAAVDAGCGDPLVRYYYGLRGLQTKKLPMEDAIMYLEQATRRFDASKYPAFLRLYGHMRFVSYAVLPTCPASISAQRKQESWNKALSLIGEFVREDPARAYLDEVPVQLVASGKQLLRDTGKAFDRVDAAMNKALPESAVVRNFEAGFYIDWAWEARGTGYADSVNEEGWKLYGERLNLAQAAAIRGFRSDPLDAGCPANMITICKGRSLERPEMEMWFTRAMLANPDNFAACVNKLDYLYPKWHGSADEALEFAHQCLEIGTAKNRIPQLLINCHSEFARMAGQGGESQYLMNSAVWKDIKAAYTKLLSDKKLLTTERARYLSDRSNFLQYAGKCGQWADFLTLSREFENEIDLPTLGGKAMYDFMKKKAEKEVAKQPM
jgi:hypothetical protein